MNDLPFLKMVVDRSSSQSVKLPVLNCHDGVISHEYPINIPSISRSSSSTIPLISHSLLEVIEAFKDGPSYTSYTCRFAEAGVAVESAAAADAALGAEGAAAADVVRKPRDLG